MLCKGNEVSDVSDGLKAKETIEVGVKKTSF